MRIKEMINRYRSSWLLSDKFSLSAPQEVYREQYGEYAYWYKGVKGKVQGNEWIAARLGDVFIWLTGC